jgi:Uma2 family endonuclease
MAQVITRPPKAPPSGKITYDEFLAWADEDVRAEWVDGEVVLMSPASLHHQRVSHFLARSLGAYVEERGLGEIVPPPFQMKLRDDLPGREPDLAFVASASRDRLHTSYIDGPAELVIEVISLESRARDRGDKYYEYEQGGVKEYWLVDPMRRTTEFYQLDSAGVYQLVPATEGVYESREIAGLSFRPGWLWQDPLPKTTDLLRTWGLLPA